jgi:hypothetical protein
MPTGRTRPHTWVLGDLVILWKYETTKRSHTFSVAFRRNRSWGLSVTWGGV